MKLIFSLIVRLLLLTSHYAKADELISIYQSNSDLSPVRIDISNISTIKFKTTKIVINQKDNTSSDFYFSDITKITFNEDGTSIIESKDTSKASIHPNPVKDVLTINNADAIYGNDICIYSVTGMLVAKHSQWNGENIDVSNLNPGVYFINTNSTTLIFVKQ